MSIIIIISSSSVSGSREGGEGRGVIRISGGGGFRVSLVLL